MAVTLHQFQSSHFNEKARWVLSLKGIEHTRISYLPGPHMGAMKKLSGQSSTPVLDWNGQIVAGSGEIVAFVDEQQPDPGLFPVDKAERDAVVDWCRRLDDSLGPAARTVVWSALISSGGYPVRVFGKSQPSAKLLAYRLVFPLIKPLIRKANGINPENIRQSKTVVAECLEDIREAVADTGYLVGHTFTAADLTAAALLAPLCNPGHPDMERPTPIPPAMTDVLASYAEHPTMAWVEQQYQDFRLDHSDRSDRSTD